MAIVLDDASIIFPVTIKSISVALTFHLPEICKINYWFSFPFFICTPWVKRGHVKQSKVSCPESRSPVGLNLYTTASLYKLIDQSIN